MATTKNKTTRKPASKKKDALALLKEDHARVREMLEQLAETTERAGKKRRDLFEKIKMELDIHAQIEEEIFYPAFKEAAQQKEAQDLYYEAQEEHHLVADVELPEMVQTDFATPEFSAKANVLKELVLHHVKEEESNMFKQARAAFSRDELLELGERLEQRKMELMRERKQSARAQRAQEAA